MPTGVYKRNKEQIKRLQELAKAPRCLRNGQYSAIHQWLYRHYGKAIKCENPMCNKTSNRFQWCLKKGKRYEHKRENFIMLCQSCHRQYDDNKVWRRNIGATSKGRTKTALQKKTISDAIKRKNRGNQQSAKAIIQTNLKGEVINIWHSATMAACFLGVSASGISMCCNGQLKQSGGYIWNFLNK